MSAVVDTRRHFVRRMFRAGAVLATTGGGAFGYGCEIERHRPVVERITIPLRGLGTAWQGFRIVQISDLHLEPLGDEKLVRAVVSIINGLKPDMVAITGDFVTQSAANLARLSEPLTDIKAPAGVYACIGNHDLFAGRWKVAKALVEHGITFMDNQGHGLTKQGETLWIAGLDSAWGGSPRLDKAFAGRPKGAGTVVVMHEPDFADIISQGGASFLQLSGHTHGGQCCLPGGVPLHLPTWGKKYAKGLFQVDQVQLYVNRGIGCITMPVRFACPPEITEITLACA